MDAKQAIFFIWPYSENHGGASVDFWRSGIFLGWNFFCLFVCLLLFFIKKFQPKKIIKKENNLPYKVPYSQGDSGRLVQLVQVESQCYTMSKFKWSHNLNLILISM